MAAITPAVEGETGYCLPHTVFTGQVTGGTDQSSTSVIQGRAGMILEVYRFPTIEDGDTWESEIINIHAVAWQPDDLDSDFGNAGLTDADTGQVTFDAPVGGIQGWLWVLRGK